MTSLTTLPDKEADYRGCWWNRFAMDGSEKCDNPGQWGLPSAGPVVRAMRWCSEHKHEDDERLRDE